MSETDSKYKYINKIVAINIREDHSDPIGSQFVTSNEKLKMIRALLGLADDMYMKHLEQTISNTTELQYLLTNRHQLLYLSLGGVRPEFQDQGLYKWFRTSVMNHIQQRYHYQRVYGISFSPASTYVHQKDGYRIVGQIKCRLFEYPEGSTNYPFKNMIDGQDEISIVEKMFTNE